LSQAQQIIKRPASTGSVSRVLRSSSTANNLVITVPGNDAMRHVTSGQTASGCYNPSRVIKTHFLSDTRQLGCRAASICPAPRGRAAQWSGTGRALHHQADSLV